MQRQHILHLKRALTLLTLIHQRLLPAAARLHELRMSGRDHVLVERVLAAEVLAAYAATELRDDVAAVLKGGWVGGGGVLVQRMLSWKEGGAFVAGK